MGYIVLVASCFIALVTAVYIYESRQSTMVDKCFKRISDLEASYLRLYDFDKSVDSLDKSFANELLMLKNELSNLKKLTEWHSVKIESLNQKPIDLNVSMRPFKVKTTAPNGKLISKVKKQIKELSV